MYLVTIQYTTGEGKPNRLCPWPAVMLLCVVVIVVLMVVLSVQEDGVPIMLVCVCDRDAIVMMEVQYLGIARPK